MSATLCNLTEQIGETAGHVWHTLRDRGPLSLTRLTTTLKDKYGVSKDHVLMALGWLAREDKLEFEDGPRGAKTVSLR